MVLTLCLTLIIFEILLLSACWLISVHTPHVIDNFTRTLLTLLTKANLSNYNYVLLYFELKMFVYVSCIIL
jgi:hypothetical protein